MQLRFTTTELLYDIKNYSYVEGDIMSNDNIRAKHHTQDIGGEGNINRVYRILQLAHAEVVEMLYPFSRSAADNNKIYSNDLVTPSAFEVGITVPSNYSETSVLLLKEAIHEYMVCRVVEDWMSIVNPAKRDTWTYKVQDARDNIKKALAKRVGLLRRGMTWGPSSGASQIQINTSTTPTPTPPVSVERGYVGTFKVTGDLTPTDILTPDFIANGKKVELTSRKYDAAIDVRKERFYYAYPKKFGLLTSAMNVVYESISAFGYMEEQVEDINGNPADYYVYYMSMDTTASGVTINFK